MALANVGPRLAHAFAGVSMDTEVHVQVISERTREAIAPAVERAMAWFQTVERICTRFDRDSEVMRLIEHVGTPVRVSTLLYEIVAFALRLAEQTGGAFDPTIGATFEQLGFNINYVTGEAIHTPLDAGSVSFRDVKLDASAMSIQLRHPLILDLNAVAKGLAIDLAMRELGEWADVCVEAGGDLYVRGVNATGELWHVGIEQPRMEGVMARTLEVTDTAVCTSGDYERRAPLLDARTRQPVTDLASVTVLAPTAMAADGLSTAAFVLGSKRGRRFLERQGVRALLISAEGVQHAVNL